MKNKNYSANFTVDATPGEVFKSINNVAKWWNEFNGSSEKLNDEFTVQFADIHTSTQRIVEFIPDKKIVWLVTDSSLSFIKDKKEWNNTQISFEIIPHGNKTEIHLTHYGLVPEIECYTNCSKGWDYWFRGSLFKYLTEGQGTPGL